MSQTIEMASFHADTLVLALQIQAKTLIQQFFFEPEYKGSFSFLRLS
jgi:hypothetical protein